MESISSCWKENINQNQNMRAEQLRPGMVVHYDANTTSSSNASHRSRWSASGVEIAGETDEEVDVGSCHPCMILRVNPCTETCQIALIRSFAKSEKVPEALRDMEIKDFTYMAISAPLKGKDIKTPIGDEPGRLFFTRGFQTRRSWMEIPQASNARTIQCTQLSPLFGWKRAPQLKLDCYKKLPHCIRHFFPVKTDEKQQLEKCVTGPIIGSNTWHDQRRKQQQANERNKGETKEELYALHLTAPQAGYQGRQNIGKWVCSF